MSCVRKIRWLLLIVFVGAWLVIGRAAVSAVQFNLQFLAHQGVWDITGNYPNTEFDTTNNIDLVLDDKGKITGIGTATGSDSGITVNLVYNFTGAIKTVSDLTSVTLTMKISGSATDGVNTLPVKGSIKLTLDLDKVNNILIGSGKGKVCVQGRCAAVDEPVQFDIPQPMDGSWTLAADLQSPDNKKIVGTATATLSNGRVIPFTITGRYTNIPVTPVTFQARFNLKGPGGTLTFSPTSHNPGGSALTKANLLGQTVPTFP